MRTFFNLFLNFVEEQTVENERKMLRRSDIVINLYNAQFPYREFIVHIINNRCAVVLMDTIWHGWSTADCWQNLVELAK